MARDASHAREPAEETLVSGWSLGMLQLQVSDSGHTNLWFIQTAWPNPASAPDPSGK